MKDHCEVSLCSSASTHGLNIISQFEQEKPWPCIGTYHCLVHNRRARGQSSRVVAETPHVGTPDLDLKLPFLLIHLPLATLVKPWWSNQIKHITYLTVLSGYCRKMAVVKLLRRLRGYCTTLTVRTVTCLHITIIPLALFVRVSSCYLGRGPCPSVGWLRLDVRITECYLVASRLVAATACG